MRSGNREINIFNMSLLDILCGALGAFCFLTITLFPFYRPDSAKLSQQSQQSIDELQKLIAQLKQGQGSAAAAQMVQQLQAQLGQLQDQLARYQKALTDSEKRIGQLEIRRPFVVSAHWRPDADVDLYFQDDTGKMPAPTIDKRQWSVWPGDVSFDRRGPGAHEVWINRDMPSGTYKIFLKLMGEPPAQPVPVWVITMYGNRALNLGSITVGPNRIVHVANVVMSRDGNVSYQPQPGLTPDEDLKKAMQAAPPPAQPAPAPQAPPR
jgi:hypothetical protein